MRALLSPSLFVSVAVLTLSAAAPVTSVLAQSGDTDARLSRMERDIETLSRSVFKGEKPPAGAMNIGAGAQAFQEQTDGRLSQLETDLRELTGRVEEQGNTLNQINRTLQDIQTRVTRMEQGAGTTVPAPARASSSSASSDLSVSSGAEDNATTPADVSEPAPNILTDGPNGAASGAAPSVENFGSLPQNATQAIPPETDPARAYENAISLLKQRDYNLAEKAFRDFLKVNPDHTLAPNAKYWLGEAYFAQNKYDQAARIFAEGYQKYPKGAKAADNLLKLGLSLAAKGNSADACVALTQISKDFPNSAAAVRNRADQEMRKLKCGG